MSEQAELPKAKIVPANRWLTWAWLIPVAAIGAAAWLVYAGMQERGIRVTIEFQAGNGIEPDDPIIYRGVEVGYVRQVSLTRDLDGVDVVAELRRDAAPLAVEGTAFWVVHPEVSLRRISGLETLLGPRYIGVSPGDGRAKRRFIGHEVAPVLEQEEGAEGTGLRLVLEAERPGSLTLGAPVTYREIAIGWVTGIQMKQDATGVDIGVWIQPRYAPLIRDNSRFWNVSGVDVTFGLGGLKLDAESLETVLTGGIAVATPDKPGERVIRGTRFELAPEPKDSWLGWAPAIDLGPPEQAPGAMPLPPEPGE